MLRSLLSVSLLAAATATTAFAQPQPATASPVIPDGTRAVLVEIMGQSNAAGVGARWDSLTPGLQATFGAVSAYASIWTAHRPIPGNQIFTPLVPGWCRSGGGPGSPDAEIGPEMSVAYRLNALYPGLDIFIVKRAVGGSSLSPNFVNPNRSWDPQLNTIYGGWLQDYTNPARDEIVNNLGYLDTEVVHLGCLWAQGYSDAQIAANANDYVFNLVDFIDEVRLELHAESAFVIARTIIPTIPPPVGLTTVRNAQVRVGNIYPDCAWSDTDGFTYSDPVHLDARSQLGNGIRLVNALSGIYAVGNTPYVTLADL